MPEINKPYAKQEFEKKGFEKGADAIVVTPAHEKRSNIDEIDDPGKKDKRTNYCRVTKIH